MTEENEKEQVQVKKSSFFDLKSILILAFIVILGSGLTSYIILKASQSSPATKNKKAESSKQVTTKSGPPFDLGEIVTNLADEGGDRYIKIKVVLAVKDEKLVEELENKKSEFRDKILIIIRSKSAKDISGSNGMETLRKEILEKMKKEYKDEVVNVLFDDFVIQ